MVKDSGKRNVLVGIRFDGHTKELLDWALVKVADPGDRVIAIHVCTTNNSDDPNAKDESSLESYLDDYDGLCTKMQVNLKAEVLRGSSRRKVLVREAKKHEAVAVIVGTSKRRALGGWTSIAKYCAKQLPTSVEVMAIHNGRIVFRRGSTSQYAAGGGVAGDPRPSFYREGRSSSLGDSQSEFGESVISEMGRLSLQERCRECGENSAEDEPCSPDKTHNKASLSLASISLPISIELDTPGWPLLRTEIAALPQSPLPVPARKMSVVQWVMTLPNRSLLVDNSSQKSETTSEEENYCSSELVNDLKLVIETNSPGCKWFSYSVLATSTCQFSSENLIGKGGCNRVYKGRLPDGKRVAVKILKRSKKAWKDFMQEIDIISAVKHRNIAPLLGICIEDSDLVSVYKFLSKGNLEENLHGKGKRKCSLGWKVRLRIATGIAEALNYLHNEHPRRPIIHRDVKSSNILLGDEFEAKLSDFGLAIWGPTKTSFETHSDVVGTFGYLAPEYFMYGKVSEKIDVYSFGVVLLELLTGRRAIGFESARGEASESLVMWAKPKLESGDVKSILDEKLNVNGDEAEAEVQRMGVAARLCLTQAARFRPNIAQIVKMLRGEKDEAAAAEMQDEESQNMDDEVYPDSSVESHISLALLDNSASFSSVEPYSVEEYLKKRWSRSSSLD